MTEKKLIIYRTQEGREPFTRWRQKLGDRVTVARIDRRIERLGAGQYGDAKAVGSGVTELRLFFGPGYRVYFAEDGERLVVLLCGGDKGGQDRDIEAAKAYWHDYQQHRPEPAESDPAEPAPEQPDPPEEEAP
ncbi:type II toxin-antitoxin system RelE/ParE family toxin [Deinococcus saxicola]|uniref:type II toxin-antitoxin system RelE/ParE family toxin n=1 Tax=Deinococcus saxicola TaxID=249406 RepID=UPI0039F1447E